MNRSRHLPWLAFLVLLATGVQCAAIRQTLLPARDSIGFIRIAHSFTTQGLLSTIRESDHHPLYPLTIAACHQLALAVGMPDKPDLWRWCAQVAAATPLVFLPLVAYGIGLRLFNPSVALGTGVLLSVLPAIVWLGADGLSDGLYLLLFLTGSLTALQFVVTQRVAWLFLSGAAAGLAYITRPEGLILPAALLMSLGLMQTLCAYRLPWSKTIFAATALIGGLGLIAVPYGAAKGQITGKHLLWRALGLEVPYMSAQVVAMAEAHRPLVNGSSRNVVLPSKVGESDAAQGAPLSLSLESPLPPPLGYTGALSEFCREFVQAFQYVFAPLALLGLLRPLERRPRRVDLVVLMILATFSGALIQAAAQVEYISTRHTLTLVCLVAYWSVHGGCVLAAASAQVVQTVWGRSPLARRVRHRTITGRASNWPVGRHLRIAAQLVLLTVAFLFCFGQACASRRDHRFGHLEAARWLIKNTQEGTFVLDTIGWAALLGNRPAYPRRAAPFAFQDSRLRYVVIEQRQLEEGSSLSQNLQTLLDCGGRLRAVFPTKPRGDAHAVAIYQFSLPRATKRLAAQQPPSATLR